MADGDVTFAEAVWQPFPDDWIYLYSKTGEHGVRMWDEIERRELPAARVIVVFWSERFSNAQGCVRELKLASKLCESGALQPVILRLDHYPLFWKPELGGEVEEVFNALRSLLDVRASEPGVSVEQANDLVSRAAEPLLRSDHPRMLRHDLLKALRQTVQRDRFTCHPAGWISGFNGVGRESLVRELNRDMAPNGRGIVVEMNEAALPRQLLLRIESAAFGADRERLAQLNQANIEDDARNIADAIERLASAGHYLIIRHARIVHEQVDLPEWLDDVIAALEPGTRPKLFILSQMPLRPDRRNRCADSLTSFRVSTVDEHTLTDYFYTLVAHFDPNPARWDDDDAGRLVRSAGGTLGLFVPLVRSASRTDDFASIDAMVAEAGVRMAESITAYVRWAFAQLASHEDEQKTLLFLNDVSPCHLLDLERAVAPSTRIVRVLGKLMDLGLVEREADEIYRLTPLLANRLSFDLIRPELVRWVQEAHRAFALQPFEARSADDGGDVFVRLESRIQSALLSGAEVPLEARSFVSAAHWFQAGIRLYHARRWQDAYRLLKLAHGQRDRFRDASRVEIDRYFCLVSTRLRKFPEAEACITRLESDHRQRAISTFLRADLHEHRRHWREAVDQYEHALTLNAGNDRRLEQTYRPLIKCILASPTPDFRRAKDHATRYVALKRTIHSLSSLARVYLRWKFKGPGQGTDVPSDIDRLYRDAIGDLESDPGGRAAVFELLAEQAEFTGDYPTAIAHMDDAIDAGGQWRPQLQTERWQLLAKSGSADMARQALTELDAARREPRWMAIWPAYVSSLAETYVRALVGCGRPAGLANAFAPELQGQELGRIIARGKSRGR